MSLLAIDIETFSDVDLPKCGVYAYSDSPRFEILLFAYAFDDEPTQVVDLARGEQLPDRVLTALEDENTTKTAFNAAFERTCISRYLGRQLSPASWQCTAVQSAMLAMPLTLDGVGEVLSIKRKKLKEMVQMSPALMRRSKITAAQKRIVNYTNNGYYQVLSAETGTKHGLNVSGLVFDEIHAQPNRQLYDVLTKGSGDAREQPLFFIITTAGTNKNSICYELHSKALDLLDGRKNDPSFYPVVYGLGIEDDWTDEANWYKANPSLGHTISVDRVREAYQNALDNPAEENVFKQLRLNIWTSATVCWIPEHMPDFMAGLARGIEQSRGAVRAAISSVADDLALAPTVSVAAGSLDALKTGGRTPMETITTASGNSEMAARLNAMYEVVTKYLPRLASRQIVLDSGTLVGELSDGMNRTLGRSFL